VRAVFVNACRLLLAAVFIFSGFVKAVDPTGTQIKILDYAEAMGLAGLVPDFMAMMAAMLLAAAEFTIGTAMLFAIRRKLMSTMAFAAMAVFTPFTLWIAVADPVSDCGCFGDAVKLTNWQTFWKNIVLLGAAFAVWRRPHAIVRLIGKSNQWIVMNYTVVFILLVSGFSLYYLPPFDFRPYHVGANIRQGMEMPPGESGPQFETTFVMEKNGERKEFTLDNYPDSTWTFVDSKTVKTAEGYTPPIHDFSIVTRDGGEDITDRVLDEKEFTFLLVAPHLEKADDSRLDMINAVHEYATENNIPFYCLTASGEKGMRRWQALTGAEYPFCITDPTTLQTMIRSNPGLMLIKDGTVAGKWSCNDLPDESSMGEILDDIKQGDTIEQTTTRKVIYIILWYILPLIVLTVADRLWAWTKWLKRKKKSNKIKILKQKKMRKKIVAGNWKMNMNLQDGIALAKELNDTLTANKPNCGVVICTPFIHLASIAQFLNQDVIGLGAENCADKEKGAYTGEVSAEMVKSTGAQYVILGHSERRGYYGETPEILKEKVLLALKNGLKVIFCIGESLEEREADKQNEVVKAELEGSVFNLTAEEFKNIVIAYEPIWAIGTGKTATAEQAEEIHAFIRSVVADKYGKEVADDTTILYGGSCKASNAPELFAKPDIDGGLIGGASLKAADFKGIIDAFN